MVCLNVCSYLSQYCISVHQYSKRYFYIIELSATYMFTAAISVDRSTFRLYIHVCNLICQSKTDYPLTFGVENYTIPITTFKLVPCTLRYR